MMVQFHSPNEPTQEGPMGLGADTIDAIAEGPYRRMQAVRIRDENRVRAIVELKNLGVPLSALAWVVQSCGPIDFFNAAAAGVVTPDEAAWLLWLHREPMPWYMRLANWFFRRSVLQSSEEPKP